MDSRTEPAEQEPETVSGRSDTPARPPFVRELLLVAGLFLVYKFGRQLANGHTAEAFRNARDVWDAERFLHLPGEGLVQDALLSGDTVVHAANTYYATVHFPATLLFLVWLYLRRPRHYLWARRVLAVLTAAALALHLGFPLAPPRLLPAAHLVDTAQVYGPSVYAAKPATDTMANQFAAMPSLHFGWALMVAVGLIVATTSRWRWLWLLHPLLTLLVIVGTANHYWVDALAATALLGVTLAVLRLPRPARSPIVRRSAPAPTLAAPTLAAPATAAPTPGAPGVSGSSGVPRSPGAPGAPVAASPTSPASPPPKTPTPIPVPALVPGPVPTAAATPTTLAPTEGTPHSPTGGTPHSPTGGTPLPAVGAPAAGASR